MKKLLRIFICLLLICLTMGFAACKTPSAVETTSLSQEPADQTKTEQATEQKTDAVESQDSVSTELVMVHQQSDVIKKNGSEVVPTTKKKIKLGLVPPISALYHETAKKGFEEVITQINNTEGYNIELLYQMPSSTGQAATTEQINIIEQWINQNIDAIALCPVADDAALEPVFKMASEKGIPVFEYGVDPTMVKNLYVTSLIIYSQYDSAKAVGEWVAENYKDKELKIAIVAGPKGPYADLRENGFKEGIKNHPNYEVVASQSGDWIRDKAVNVTENMLTAHPEVNLVYCMYDEMAMGAISAISNKGQQDQVDVIGYDINIESLQAIKDGSLKCSVYNGTKEAGQDIVKAIKNLVMDGKEISKAYLFPPMVVSAQNVNDFDQSRLKID